MRKPLAVSVTMFPVTLVSPTKKLPSLWVSLDNAVVSIRVDASVATA